jgi:formylglycine-generating enzyme required for sulfatase activity
MVLIPGGEFVMGCDPQHNGGLGCPQDELPLHTVTLSNFYIDKYEVTNIQYAECVAADGCQPPMSSASELVQSYFGYPDYDYYPVVHVSWLDAADYCTWAGKRLPTEAEWEKAARGSAAVSYPWGDDEPTCALSNYQPAGTTGLCSGDTTPVGSHPLGASEFGIEDMAGNVWEWVSDWYGETYYQTSPGENPPGPEGTTYRVLRGGGWTSAPIHLRISSRAYDPDFHNASDVGFRCASDTGD